MSTSPAACVQLRGPQQSDVPCAESALDPADPTSETLFVDVFMVKMMSTQRLKNLLIQSKSGVIGLPFGDPKKALTWTMIGALETPFAVNMKEGKFHGPESKGIDHLFHFKPTEWQSVNVWDVLAKRSLQVKARAGDVCDEWGCPC